MAAPLSPARWHTILEDEAQDSTPLQEHILSLLGRDHNNWVRVGDPNQAIMTTFTASDVRFFRQYEPGRGDYTRERQQRPAEGVATIHQRVLARQAAGLLPPPPNARILEL